MDAITLKARYRNYKVRLELDNKITVIVGLSATGKSTLHKVLEVNDRTKIIQISDNRYKLIYLGSQDILHDIIKDNKLDSYRIYLIDEGKIEIDNEVASIIRRTRNSYFIITSRTELGKLNFALDAVKHLVTNSNGVITLQNFLGLRKKSINELKNIKLDEIVIEDSGKAKQWFDVLFIPLGMKCKTPNEGKEKVCDLIENLFESGVTNILAIFDECSFGTCIKKLKYLVELYQDRLNILSNYKSWEYLILQTNMYRRNIVEYGIDSDEFEESYYENLLDRLSNKAGKKTHISHESSKNQHLSKCYTEPCCFYSKGTRECSIGLKGKDKFVALLTGTEFENILILAHRKGV